MCEFLKTVDLNPKNEKLDVLFFVKWTSTLEMWTIMRNYLKKGALELRNVDL